MVEASDRIRRDIEDTRDRLSREIDELADRTLPHRIVKRGWEHLRGRDESDADDGRDTGGGGLPLSPDTDAETDSMLDPEPTTPADALGRGRVLAIGLAALAVGLAIGGLLWSRSRRRGAG